MKFKALILFSWLLVCFLGHAQADQALSTAAELKLSTILEVIKNGQTGQVFLIQGKITAIDKNSRIILDDGTYQIGVYLSKDLPELGMRPNDMLLVEGIARSVFLQGNVLVATTIQKIDQLLPMDTKIQKKMQVFPQRISSDPNTVTPIREVNWYAADGQFVTIKADVLEVIETDRRYKVQDATGAIILHIPESYDELKLKENSKLVLRARVAIDEAAETKELFALFIDAVDGLPTVVTPNIHIKNEGFDISAESSKPVVNNETVVTKPVIIGNETIITDPQKTNTQQGDAAETKAKANSEKQAQTAPSAAAATEELTLEQRLRRLKKLRTKQLITEAEYQTKRQEIIDAL